MRPARGCRRGSRLFWGPGTMPGPTSSVTPVAVEGKFPAGRSEILHRRRPRDGESDRNATAGGLRNYAVNNTNLLDEQHTTPVVVVDEAQHLSDRFLADLAGFLNFAFDRRSLAAVWLVGLSSFARRLRMQLHAPLYTRVVAHVQLLPLERDDFKALIEHGIRAAGSKDKLLTDPALELLFRASRGIPRIASRVLRASLKKAHAKNQSVVDDHVLRAAVEELAPAEEVVS